MFKLRRLFFLSVLFSLLFATHNTPRTLADGDPVMVGAGDIATCGLPGAAQTADLLDNIPGLVFAAGDTVYPSGTAENYQKCYEPTWGRHKERTRAVAGNHDYQVEQGKYFYDYFGESAGPDRKGYYSFNLGAWHVVMLNSNAIRGLQEEETLWLHNDLAANPTLCTLAIVHDPVFSSAVGGVSARSRTFFIELYNAHADVMVSGDAHNYERFAPQNLHSKAEPDRGIRQFVVGTGGAVRNPFGRAWVNSEVRDTSTWGVLKLTLHPDSYSWEFLPVGGGAAHDSGTAPCIQ